tara:strand:+ start:426 stop:722 length:297 start_codon:yes stop_codon:yes gene_type:complete
LNYLITESCLVLKLKDCSELLIKTKPARFACPCAQCGGERDVFGNVYKKDRVLQLSGRSFEILKIQPVGNYGIKIFWGDNHSDGIYTFDFLKKLSLES